MMMMIKHWLIAGAVSLALVSTAHAQTATRNSLQTFNNTYITSNGRGSITGPIVNGMFNQVINGVGVLGDTNVWSASNTFNGPFVLNSPLASGLFQLQAANVVADNQTNNYSNLLTDLSAAAGSSAGTLILPAGQIVINFPTNGAFSLGQGVCLVGQGEGKTTLILQGPAAATLSPFTANGAHACIKNLTITSQLTGAGQYVTINAPDFVVDHVYLDGGNTFGQPAVNTMHGFLLNGAFDGFQLTNSYIYRVRYGLLKSNSNTNAQRNILIANNVFDSNEGDDISLNTPNGVIDGVDIHDNISQNNNSGSAYGTFGICFGMASATNVHMYQNTFRGPCQSAFVHIEENSVWGQFDHNNINSTVNGADGFQIVPNNVNTGGVSYAPQHLNIDDNHIYSTIGASNTGRGINVENTAQTAQQDMYVEIHHNDVLGWGYCAFIVTSNWEIVDDNLFTGCNVGLGGTKPSAKFHDNLIKNNGIAYSFSYGGMIGVNPLQSNTSQTSITQGTGGNLISGGLEYRTSSVSVATGAASYVLMPSGHSFHGKLAVSALNIGGPWEANASYSTDFDGTTLTGASPVSSSSSGGFTLGALGVGLAKATTAASGSGGVNGTGVYTVGGGTCSVQPTLNVTWAAGVMTVNSVANPGVCTVVPTSPAALTYASGTATGWTGATASFAAPYSLVILDTNSSGGALNTDFDATQSGPYEF